MSTHGGGQTRARTTTARTTAATAKAAQVAAYEAAKRAFNPFHDAMPGIHNMAAEASLRRSYREQAAAKIYEGRKWNHPAPVMAAPHTTVTVSDHPLPSWQEYWADQQKPLGERRYGQVDLRSSTGIRLTLSRHTANDPRAKTAYDAYVRRVERSRERAREALARLPTESAKAAREREAWNSLPVRTLSGRAHDLQIDLDHARLAVMGETPGTPKRATAEARYYRVRDRLNAVYAQRTQAINDALGRREGGKATRSGGGGRRASGTRAGGGMRPQSLAVSQKSLTALRSATHFTSAQADTMARYLMQQHPDWTIGQRMEPYGGMRHRIPITTPSGYSNVIDSWAAYERALRHG